MANYKTHKNFGISITVLILISIIVSSLVLKENIEMLKINIQTIIVSLVMGIIGSIMPDIDLKNTIPYKIFKNFLYLLAILILFLINMRYSSEAIFIDININNLNITQIQILIEVLFTFLIIYIFIKWFDNNTIHRGLMHSIPFAIFTSILNIQFFSLINEEMEVFRLNTFVIGFLFFAGYITHLILDEYYSIDFYNKKIKKSFGSALKLIDKNNLFGTFLIYSYIILYTYIKIYQE